MSTADLPPSTLRSHFPVPRTADFSSTDPVVIWGQMQTMLAQVLPSITADTPAGPLYGHTLQEILPLHRGLNDYAARTERLHDVRQKLGDLSNEQLGALMHLESIKGMLWTASHVMAERNLINEKHSTSVFSRESRRMALQDSVRTLVKAGYNPEQIRDLYSHKKTWITFTPHPTKDKSPRGDELFRALTKIAEDVPPAERAHAIEGIMHDMVLNRLTSLKKDTYADETQDGLKAQAIYNNGMLDYFEDLQMAMDEVLGPSAVNFLDESMHMDMASRKWHGGDADGKQIPATVLFNERVLDALKGAETYLSILEASSDRPEPLPEILRVLTTLRNGLQHLAAQGPAIEQSGSHNGLFSHAQKEFSDLFLSTAYRGKTHDNGHDLMQAMFDDLQVLHDQTGLNENLRSCLWRALFMNKQNGLSIGRLELRHNGDDIETIFENLYQKILKPQGFDPEFSKAPAKTQAVFLKRLMQEYGGDQIRDWLIEDNPVEEGKAGWPREILERFALVGRCYNHHHLGAAIIAEANAISPVKQQVLAEAFGIRGMVHIPLNESQETIRAAASSMQTYRKVFGNSNLMQRTKKAEANFVSEHNFFCIMNPQSDSQKLYGVFIYGDQRDTTRKIVSGLFKELQSDPSTILTAILTKFGNGVAAARGGFSPKVVPRTFINAMTWEKQWLDKRMKAVLRQMASFVSATAQGRDIGLRYGTNAQVYDMLAGIDAETNAAALVIDEKLPPEKLEPSTAVYSEIMKRVLREARHAQTDRYNKILRNEESLRNLGLFRLDLWANETSALKLCAEANTGARPASRNKFTSKILDIFVTGARAIGCNIAIENSETYFDGSYTVGSFFQHIHAEYKKGTISRDDLNSFYSDKFYMEQIFGNAFASLAAADYQHGFDKTDSWKGHKWTVGHLREVKKHNYKDMPENLAFQAVLAYDAVLATAYMEAFLNYDTGAFDKSEDEMIDALYKNSDMLAHLKFGPMTRDHYPDIATLETYAADKRLARAAVHEIEARIRDKRLDPVNEDNKSMLIGMATARRLMGPINLGNLLDRVGSSFGAREEPVMKIAAHYLARTQPQPVVRGGEPAVQSLDM